MMTNFWVFACDVYGAPGVSARLLELQDDCGADVIAILYALWRGTRGEALSSQDAARIFQTSAQWSAELTAPVRRARRSLSRKYAEGRRVLDLLEAAAESGEVARAYKALAAAELAVERAAIVALEAMVITPRLASPSEALACNLAAYAAHASRVSEQALAPLAKIMLTMVHPQTSPPNGAPPAERPR